MGRLDKTKKPEGIAQTALFFASDALSYITGAELIINGGFSAQ